MKENFINNELIEGKLYDIDIKYQGEFHNFKIDGKGILYYKNKIIYAGDFKNNYMHGNGIFHFMDIGRYEGEMKNNEINCKGTFYFCTAKYEGEYRINNKDFLKDITNKVIKNN